MGIIYRKDTSGWKEINDIQMRWLIEFRPKTNHLIKSGTWEFESPMFDLDDLTKYNSDFKFYLKEEVYNSLPEEFTKHQKASD
jgi:hypothetical protein